MRRRITEDYMIQHEPTPDIDKMTDDALKILSQELTRFKVKSLKNLGLDEKEARILQGYIRSLMEIRREEREAEKTEAALDAFKNMTNEQLLEEAAKLLIKPPAAK